MRVLIRRISLMAPTSNHRFNVACIYIIVNVCVVVVWSYSVGYSSSKFYLCYGTRSQLMGEGVLLDPGWAWGGGGTCHLKE